MSLPLLRINAVTRANRDDTIARVRTAIAASGAWIVDVKLFSNVSVCFNFEVPHSRIAQLRDGLAETELSLTKDSVDSFSNQLGRDVASMPAADIIGSLQITFIHNEPDLRVKVPQIPG